MTNNNLRQKQLNATSKMDDVEMHHSSAELKETVALAPPSGGADPQDVRSLQDRLKQYAAGDEASPDTGNASPVQNKQPLLSPTARRLGKVLLGAVAVAAFGLIPLRTLLQTSSVEAVVNARVMTLRSPIAGEVVALPADLASSEVLPQGAALLRLVNPRADRGRLDTLEQAYSKLSGQREVMNAKLAAAQIAEADLDRQAEEFRLGRIDQLTARTAELESLITVATARREEAIAARGRAEGLARTGNVSTAEFDRLTREVTVATGTETAARHRLAATSVELAAARNRIFLGDSYNDRPSSVQRGDEIRQRIADLRSDLAGLETEAKQLGAALDKARTHFEAQSDIAMTLPVAGRIWETMVSPGEQVRLGQDLVRLIDCSTVIVTANVTESVYSRLTVGSSARFIPADGGKDLQGKVVNLTGLAIAAANLAIEPAALSKEPYRVTVSVPGLGTGQSCAVGRTGRVVFGEQVAAP